MKFNPTKCFTMTLASRKPTPTIYTFCGQQLKSVQSHCYLGVQISNTLNWTAQCNSVARKAQQTLGVIRRNLNKCPTHIKSIAYTTLVRPILEYASWDPHCLKHIKTLERIQRQAARFCTQNYSTEPGTVTQLLKDLQCVKNDPPWDACAGEVTSQDMCECVCVGVPLSLLVCARQNRFDPRFRVK